MSDAVQHIKNIKAAIRAMAVSDGSLSLSATIGGEISEPPAPLPDMPAEVWNTRPVNAERCMDAVRAMCGG